MRRFLILTRREVCDHAGYLIASLIMSAFMIALLISLTLEYQREFVTLVSLGVLIPWAIMLGIALCAFGAAQMRLDRTRNLSAFLTTLPVGRGQVFLARVGTGVLGILLFLVPLTITAAILIDLRSPPVPLFRGLLPALFAGVFLACLACYGLGLYAGSSARALASTLSAVLFAMLVPLLLAIKGFGVEPVVILLLFVAASLAGTWERFSSSSL